MTKDEAINKLLEIKKIAYNSKHSTNKRLSDIITVLDRLHIDDRKRKRPPMRVSINGVTYASVDAAAIALKIYPITIRNRCVSINEKFKHWEFVYTP